MATEIVRMINKLPKEKYYFGVDNTTLVGPVNHAVKSLEAPLGTKPSCSAKRLQPRDNSECLLHVEGSICLMLTLQPIAQGSG